MDCVALFGDSIEYVGQYWMCSLLEGYRQPLVQMADILDMWSLCMLDYLFSIFILLASIDCRFLYFIPS